MSSYFAGKRVLVTGGTNGLGRVIAEVFGRAGARVALAGLEEADAHAAAESMTAAGVDAIPLVGDVTDEADVERFARSAAERFGGLDILVNAAGRTHRGWILETPSDEILSLFKLNLLGTVQMTRAALPYLLKSESPHVVNIGSLAAKSASRWVGAYPISKFPVAAFSQQLRLEMKEKGLHVLLVCPGPVKRDNPRLYPLKHAEGIPESALMPGGGVKVGKIDPVRLAEKILDACRRRKPELVVPGKARLLFAVQQLFPRLGDWIVLKKT
ncbi:MAG: SDR family NAD(P)-dependent oxidoreductase [Thermoguttaceae bacterium]|nr:SDR family NAD(P)-dependent oxidoreductase [Thermoguttaceae bacterium]